MTKHPRLGAALFALFASLSSMAADHGELVFLNWADYVDPGILEEFRERTGISVKQAYFESDGARDELLLETDGKGYDLAVVDGISLRVLAKRGWLEPVLEEEIPNIRHIYPRWRDAHAQAREFGVPYFWGTTGIAYRRDLVEGPVNSWLDLFRPKEYLRGKIGMISDAKDVASHAMKALGYSLNSSESGKLDEVEALLVAQAPFVKTYNYVSLDKESAIVSGEIVMSIMYNGDALMVREHNENISFVVPGEGGNIWVDYLCILSGSSNKPAARRFINFLNEPDIAARLAEHVYYATPNRAAEAFLPREHLADPIIYPGSEILERSEFYKKLPVRADKRRAALFSRIVR